MDVMKDARYGARLAMWVASDRDTAGAPPDDNASNSQQLSKFASKALLLIVAALMLPSIAAVFNAVARVTGGPYPAQLLVAPDPLSDAVAATAGDFRVDESGAATYTIPLYAVPGTAGMTPALSLQYSTHNGYGPLGKGWSIGGISAITRCRMTREAGDFIAGGVPTDGNASPINYTATDRYCLDGVRLIPAQAGGGECPAISGMTALNLRTEVETFQRACGYIAASSTSGVAFFTVEGKDGTTRWYGDRDNNTTANRSDGYFNSTRPGFEAYALSWALTRTQDAFGNYNDYTYLKNQDGAVGEHLISEVRYSGKTVLSGQSGSALAPYAKLSFNYSVRPGTQQSQNYAYGGQLSQVHRLESVIACASGGAGACAATAQAKVYSLTYAASTSGSGFETVTAIQECRDTAKTACASPTTFDWSQATNGFATSAAWNTGVFPSTKNLIGLKFGDIDGDGRVDLVWVQGGSGQCASTAYLYVAFGESDGGGRQGFSPANQFVTCTPAKVTKSNWEVFDYNADGRADLMVPAANGTWAIYPSLGRPNLSYTFDLNNNLLAGLSPGIHVYPPSDFIQGPPELLDINGDAQLDALYLVNKTTLKVRLMQPNASGWGPELAVNVSDFQQFEPCPPSTQVNCLFFKQYVLPSSDRLKYQLLDMDGDGRSDIKLSLAFGFTIDPQCPYCATTGGEFAYRVTDINGSQVTIARYAKLTDGSDYRLGDFNGDGLIDKISRSFGTSPTWSVVLNTGVGFTAPVSLGSLPSDNPSDGLVKVEDINRDGRTDLLYVVSEGSRKVFRVRYAQPDGSFGPESVIPGNNAEACAGSGCDPKLKAHLFADLDADGTLDFFAIKLDDNPDFFLSQSAVRGVPRDVVTRITDGFGAKIDLRYSPLTNAAVYRRDSGTRSLSYGRGASVGDLFDGGYSVVSQVTSSAPTLRDPEAMAAAYYRYAGAKMQGGGRGFLGFREISVFDTSRPAGYLVTTSNYRQDFPFIGRPTRTTKRAFASQTFAPSYCLTAFPNNTCYATPGQGFDQLGGVVVADSAQVWESDAEVASAAVAPFAPGVQAPVQVRTTGSEESRSDLATGAQTSRTLTALSYGGFGSTVQSVMDTFTGTSTASMHTVITSNSFVDDVARWRLGLMATSTVTHQRPGVADVVRSTGYTRDLSGAATGALTEERNQPAGPADQALTTAYTLDAYGNRVQATACAAPATNCSASGFVFQPADALAIKRYGRVEYDAQGRYVTASYEPFASISGAGYEEQATTRTLDRDIFGNVTQQLDVNGVQSMAYVGRLGRPYYRFTRTTPLSTTTQGVTSLTTYRWCGPGAGQVPCPTGARFRVQLTETAQARQWTYVDALGRAILSATETLNIGVSGADVSASCADYDASGNPVRRSVPFFLPGTAGPDGPTNIASACTSAQRLWMTTTYDVLQRPTRVLSPDGTDILMTHSGLNTTSSDPRRNATTQTRNGQGEVVAVTDALGTATSYGYTADGQVARVSRNVGSGVITNAYAYDALGRNTQQIDPDVGTTAFQYNALGELIAQTDNAGGRVEFQLDARGRPYRKTVKRPDGSVESQATSTFDTGLYGVGRLATESMVDTNADWVASGQNATMTYLAYDALGRPSSTATFVGDQYFGASIQYDTLGRPWKSQDVSGRWNKTEYDSRGNAVAICASDSIDTAFSCPSNADTYQRTLATDPWGHVIRERRGNHASMEVVQSFQPENGRLQRICAGDASCQLVNEAYAWDAAGNLSTRQKDARYVEVFAFDGLNRLTEAKLTVRNGASVNEVTLAQSYDALGNVCSKNGSAYAYPGGDGCPSQPTARSVAQADAEPANRFDARLRLVSQQARRDAEFADWRMPAAWRGRALRQANDVAYARYGSANAPQAGLSVSSPRAAARSVVTKSAWTRYSRNARRHAAPSSPTTPVVATPIAAAAPLTAIASPHAVTQVGTGGAATLYSYDAVGRQVGRDAPGTTSDRTVAYTSDGNARDIQMGNGQRIRYWYGPSGQRYRKQEGGKVTLYLGNVELVSEAGTSTYRRYIAGAAVQTLINGVATTRYLFHDQLGSVVRITNADGSIAEGLDYAADGARRSTADPRNSGSASNVLPRGYTGHEMLDGTDLIHMNGRVYDPQLGRFLQADPYVQTPTRLQSWNAYSYVDNNPLTYNDPSGNLIGAVALAATSVTLQTITVTASVVSVSSIAAAAAATAVTVAVTTTSASGVSGAYSSCPTSNSAGDKSTSNPSTQPSSEATTFPNELPKDAVAWIDPMGEGQGTVLLANGETALVINITPLREAAPVAAGCADQLATAGVANAVGESGIAQLQTALDFAGFLPVVGTAADVLNAGIYAYRGDYAMAAMSAVGAVPLVGDAFAAGAKGARALHAAGTVGRTNAELVQQIATRAEAWGTRQGLPAAGGGPAQGTLKHGYARKLLDRYQSMYGDRGLVSEVSFKNGQEAVYGTKGSVRLDVYEPSTGSVWDYKFTQNPSISSQRVQSIKDHVPGVTSVNAVGP